MNLDVVKLTLSLPRGVLHWQVKSSGVRVWTHQANFCVFCEKICHHFRDTSAPGDFFSPPNFVKHYQTSKAPLSCFWAGQIFVRCENCTDFTICTAWSKEKVSKCTYDYQIENLAETNCRDFDGPNKFCQSSASRPQ